MAVKSNNQPAPQRQVVLTFATPSVADILFYETVDGQRIGTAVPDYGTPHPDSRRWPNHKLVFIQNDDEVGQMLRYYYAADRASQDAYNYELTDGLSLTRTYVIPRSDYPTNLPVPVGGAADSVFTSYGFVSDSIVDVGQPLNGLYIVIQRKFEPITRTEIQYSQNLEANVITTTTLKPFGYTLVTTQPAPPPAPQITLEVSGPGIVYEVKYVNAYHSLLVKTQAAITIPTTGATAGYIEIGEVHSMTMYKLPNILTSYSIRSVFATAFSEEPPDYSEAMDFIGLPEVQETSDGPYPVRTRRFITGDPSTVISVFSNTSAYPRIPTPPEDGTVAVVGAKWWYVPEKGVETFAQAREFQVPRALQGGAAVGGGVPSGFSIFSNLDSGGPRSVEGDWLIEASSKEIELNLYEVSVSFINVSNSLRAINFAPISNKITTNTVTLTATSSVPGNPVTFEVTDGPAAISNNNVLYFTGAGVVTVTASQAPNGNFEFATTVSRSFTVFKAPGTVTLLNLSQTYDGTPRPVSATTNPSGRAVTFTYDGSATAPTNAGSYAVVGTINSPTYQGSATGTLVVSPLAQTITFNTLPNQLITSTLTLSATGGGSGNPVTFAVTSGPAVITSGVLTFTGAGSVTITASQAGNANYNAATSVSRSLTVSKLTATVTLSNLSQYYNGEQKYVTATTSPSGKTVVITYNGGPTAPTEVGSYTVVGTIDDPTYQGSVTDTLEII